jgi:flagellar protein FlaJ
MPKKKFILRLADWVIRLAPQYFKPLEEVIKLANIGVLYEVYIGRMVFLSLFSFIAVFIYMLFMLIFIGNLPVWFSIPGAFFIASLIAVGILTIFHSYPYQVMSSKKTSIENNLPFALNHMAAVAASGVPPAVIFRLLAGIKEYGQVAEEAAQIVRNMETFGMDMITSIKQVADRTPSAKFREFLYSIISTIETGGDLKKFLKAATQESLFEYRLRRERYLQTLSTYADFYTAVLIAAPLFFISILSVMAMIGGNIMGMSILDAMQLGIYFFIPLLNIVFIAFIHFTQPAV